MKPNPIRYVVSSLPMQAGSVPSSGAPVAPTAEFIGAPTSGTAPVAVVFTNQSTGAYSAQLWDFGDGSTSTSANPTHNYTAAGTYTVTLTLTWVGGTVNRTRTAYIVAGAASPSPALTFALADTGVAGVAATGSITNTGSVASGPWSIAAIANSTMTPSSGGSIAPGASVSLSFVATVAATYTPTLVCSGATITGASQPIVVSAAPATVATLSVPSTGTTGVDSTGYVSLNGVSPAAGSITISAGAGSTLSTTTLSWSAGESGTAKPFQFRYSGDGVHSISIASGIAGVTVAGTPAPHTTSGAGSGLFSGVGYDAQTPEHISFYMPTLRAYAAGTRVNVRYKATSSGTWLTAHQLIPIDPAISESGGPETIVPAFAGTIFDLAPGVNYNVELTVVEPGQADVVLTGIRAARALPAAAGAATKNYPAMGGTLQAAFDGLVPGDVLVLANGTYDVNSLLLNVAGSSGSPIYIRGQSRAGTIIRDLNVEGYTGIITLRNAAHVVIEDITLQGNGVDSGISESFSTAIVQSAAGTSIRPTNVTMRRVSGLGVDRGFVAFLEVDGFLLYDCTLRGNNTWDKSWTDNPAAVLSYPNWTWNDDGVRMPGDGNCAFNNTLSGFGDCFANGGSPSDALRCHATYFYRNKIEMTGDDTWEADYASRNVAFYDNYVANCGTLFSADPVYGGPSWCFRNVCINAWRGPFKWNSYNSGMLVYANTINKCGNSWRGGAGDVWNQPNNGGASPAVNWSFRNNLLYKTGTGANTNILSFDANGSTNYDVDHNGWFSDGRFAWPNQLGTSQSFASLAAARAGLPALPGFMGALARHTGDIIVANDAFDPPMPLTDYQTQYTALALPTLRAGTTARNAGAAISGITDGYSGAAPDMGAIISGRAPVQYGDQNGAALNLVSGVWTPNRDGAGDVIQSDFDALPTMQWIEVGGTNNKLQDVQQTPIYGNSTGATAVNYLTGPWCGAAWDAVNKRLIHRGGGHVDSSPAETGVLGVSAKKMRCERLVDRSAQGTGPNYTDGNMWQYNRGSNTFENWTPGSGSSFDGTPWPLRNGLGSAPHTYWGLEHIPPATMASLGFAGNVNGGLFCYFPFQIINLDTGLHTIPWWWYAGGSGQDPEVFWSTTYPVSVVNGTEVIFPYGYFYHARVSLTEKQTTRWSSQIGGTQSDSKVYQAAGSGPGLANHGDCIVVKMQERGEYVHIFGGTTPTGRRVRYAAARTAGVSDWTAYTDAITLTSSDGSHGDFTTANLLDSSGSPLNAAGSAYDHSTGTIWLRGNLATGKLYSITGLGGSTWTVTRFNVTPRYGEQGTHGNYNKFAFVQFGAVKLLMSITGMDHPIQVCRIA